MDSEEIIILSSDDEIPFESDQIPSDRSNARSRAFFDPDELSLDSDDLLGGMDLSLRILSIFISVCYDYQKWKSTLVSQATRSMLSM